MGRTASLWESLKDESGQFFLLSLLIVFALVVILLGLLFQATSELRYAETEVLRSEARAADLAVVALTEKALAQGGKLKAITFQDQGTFGPVTASGSFSALDRQTLQLTALATASNTATGVAVRQTLVAVFRQGSRQATIRSLVFTASP